MHRAARIGPWRATRPSGHAPGGQSYTGLPGSAPGQPCGHLAMRLEVKVTPGCPDRPWPAILPPGHAAGGQSYTGLPGSAPGQPHGHLTMLLGAIITPGCPDRPLASHTAIWPCPWGSKLHRAARIGPWPAMRPPGHAAGGQSYTGLSGSALASHTATWPCGWGSKLHRAVPDRPLASHAAT